MKALLHKHFSREAEHHVAKAKHHRAIAEHAGKLQAMHKAAKSDMEGLDELLQSYIDAHSAISDEHVAYADHCLKCATAVADSHKAAGFADGLDDLMPLPVSRVTPDAPKVFAVPRFGQRETQKADVPAAFQKLVSIEDEE